MIDNEILEWETINHPSPTTPNYTRSIEDDTSICWNYVDRTVEIFTNRRRIFEKCIDTNSNYLKRSENDRERVYTIEYSFDELRSPEKCLIKHRSPAARGLNEPVGL